MMQENHNTKSLTELILAVFEETADQEQLSVLRKRLQDNPKAIELYSELSIIYAGLRTGNSRTPAVSLPDSMEACDQALWQALAENERTAETLKIEKKPQPPELVTNIRERKKNIKIEHRVSYFNLWTAIVSTAALILVLVYVSLNPQKNQLVATVSDSIGAKWSQDAAIETGQRLYSFPASYCLQKGYAKLLMDDGAEVILEGPVQFSLMDAGKVFLQNGQIYASVPKNAIGFTVDTPAASVVDIGTEFGVNVTAAGETEVHLFRGKASLVSGVPGKTLESRMLAQGEAQKVDTSGHVHSIDLATKGFVRGLNSKAGVVWHGEPIDLADVVSGGDGFGTSQLPKSIHPVTGKVAVGITPTTGTQYPTGNHAYNRVAELPFVDGVFVPDRADDGPPQISSAGHVFEECPDTSNYFWVEIFNTSRYQVNTTDYVPRLKRPQLNGEFFDTLDNPSIFMVANVGITFDLQNIRNSLPGVSIRRFRSICGVDKGSQLASMDIWVLVDGRLRYSRRHISYLDQAEQVDIELDAKDRFLTLVATDNNLNITDALGVIGRPVLVLE